MPVHGGRALALQAIDSVLGANGEGGLRTGCRGRCLVGSAAAERIADIVRSGPDHPDRERAQCRLRRVRQSGLRASSPAGCRPAEFGCPGVRRLARSAVGGPADAADGDGNAPVQCGDDHELSGHPLRKSPAGRWGHRAMGPPVRGDRLARRGDPDRRRLLHGGEPYLPRSDRGLRPGTVRPRLWRGERLLPQGRGGGVAPRGGDYASSSGIVAVPRLARSGARSWRRLKRPSRSFIPATPP